MSTSPRVEGLLEKLEQHFGFKRFRAGQAEAVKAAIAGRDVVVVMPTGSGKSLCYQLSALESRGTTVVVSPLIALMKDQADNLRGRGFAVAEMNSALPTAQLREAQALIAAGRADFVLVTPEGIADPGFREQIRRRPVGLFVVDEAHCVSQWGHDFRPDYLGLRDAAFDLGRPPVLALTATATPAVVEEIRTRLNIPEAEVVHTGFYRSNIALSVEHTRGEGEKRAKLLELLANTTGTTVVYCATVKAVEELTDFFAEQELVGAGYHGRMPAKRRAKVQARFMAGELHLFVATNAFGLGIDKPDIRHVIHYHMPGSLEAYYQEFGRAGRDGLPARGTLLYDPDDRKLQRFFQVGRYPDDGDLVNVYHAVQRLADREAPPTLKEIQAVSPLKDGRTKVCLALLAGQGIVENVRGGRYRLLRPGLSRQAVAAASRSYSDKEDHDRAVLEKMVRYADGPGCRWQALLSYFDDDALLAGPCHHCDNDPAVPDEKARLEALRKSVQALAARG
ncbi:MAG: ATP-dependent DNA helicase RecQ [Gemmataceae bacterium]